MAFVDGMPEDGINGHETGEVFSRYTDFLSERLAVYEDLLKSRGLAGKNQKVKGKNMKEEKDEEKTNNASSSTFNASESQFDPDYCIFEIKSNTFFRRVFLIKKEA